MLNIKNNKKCSAVCNLTKLNERVHLFYTYVIPGLLN